MRILLTILGALVLIGGIAALGYALSLALPYLNNDANSVGVALIYQKATFYGIIAIACFGLTGLLIAVAGSVGYRSKPTN
ncbi:MAG: hypothetical protein ACYDBJ_11925 [Aggregatilineales bacterium]